ncbi:spermatogenesis-associated protein 7-like [Diadema antillarum]|uniref:spermatogenesis-associated protein 7-like n=1 Tax=Diadema antillarum TaxID=105358 RepID=UPI003A89E300
MADPSYRRNTPTPAVPPSPVSFKGQHKGHLALKSSPYATTCKRALNQNDVVTNLNVHYRKLSTAKSRIDSTTPKTWTLSTVKKDQLRRQAMEKQKKKLASQKSSSRPASRNTIGTNADDLNLDLDEDLVDYGIPDNQVPRSAPMTPTKAFRPHSAYSDRNQHTGRPRTSQSQFNATSGTYRSGRNGELNTTTMDYRSARTPNKQSGDILDKRASKFTEANRMYTPRTLKTNATSRLSQSRNYNPPKKKSSSGTKRLEETENYEQDRDWDVRNTRNLHSREQLKELDKRDRRENARLQRAEDHLRWVEEQALRVQTLEIDDQEDDDQLQPMSSTLKPARKGARTPLGGTQDLNVSYGNQSLRSELASMTYRTPEQVTKRMQEEEEELRYLEFVTDVTNDVLNRGIYTNTVLKQVFESHIERNIGRLDEVRMRHLMKQLQEDLAIPSSDQPGDGT